MAWYIDLNSQTITSSQPDITGRVVVPIALVDGTTLSKFMLHINAIESMLTDPFGGISNIILEIDSLLTWYIDLLPSVINTSQPDMTNKIEVPVSVVDGSTISQAIAQLNALSLVRMNPFPTPTSFVVKVTMEP